MSTKCRPCEIGPAGPAGHDDLFSHAFAQGKIVVKCRACGTCWSRRPTTRDFSWHEVDASVGSLLPSVGI